MSKATKKADAAGDEAGEDDLENSQFEITVDGSPTRRLAGRASRRRYIRHGDVPFAPEQGQRAQASGRPGEPARQRDAAISTSTG